MFDECETVIRVSLCLDNQVDREREKVTECFGWTSDHAELAWCVGVQIGSALRKLFRDDADFQTALEALGVSVEGMVKSELIAHPDVKPWFHEDAEPGPYTEDPDDGYPYDE